MSCPEQRLFSYIVKWDGGLAPNPYWEYCTLAVCKPGIRRIAVEGDWVIGLSPRSTGYHFVYAMQVGEILSFGQYFDDGRFACKKPDMDSLDFRLVMGDNFYQLNDDGEYEQLRSNHSYSDGREYLAKKTRDLSGRKVLVARDFYYYGGEGRAIPDELGFLFVGQAYRCRFSQKEIEDVLKYIDRLKPGVHGEPRDLEWWLRWLERVWRKG